MHGCTRFSMRYVFCLFFFFSSRRRHTRFDCDWSSDVCSSDLNPTIYWPDLATTLNDLAILAHKQDDMRPAQEWIEEALIINRDLWRNDPAAHGDRKSVV